MVDLFAQELEGDGSVLKFYVYMHICYVLIEPDLGCRIRVLLWVAL